MKRALLVGINAYRTSPLRGCINDTVNMKSFLLKNGFSENNIATLNDNAATAKNIRAELEKLVASGEKGDTLVFHYSGHGSQIPDVSGDEADRLDEILCPIDIDKDWYANSISDDYLNATLNKIKEGILLEIFLDCCHSGTGTRNILLGRASEEGSRYMMPPREIFKESLQTESTEIKAIGTKQDNRVIWSGCRDDQTSADAFIKGNYCGAFTYGLLNNYVGNRQKIISTLRSFMIKNKYSQVPQLTCSVEQNNVNIFEIGKYIPVVSVVQSKINGAVTSARELFQ